MIIGVMVATLPRAEYEDRSPPLVPDTLPSPTQCGNGKAGYLRAGQEVFCRFDETTPFAANRLAGVRDGGKWGWIDADGKEVIAPRYRAAEPFSADGFAPVQAQGDIWFLIDRNGARVAPDPLLLTPGGCRNGKKGYFHGDWELYCAFDETSAFAPNQLASARKNGQWGWIDARGETVIPFRYQEVIEDFGSEDGLAMVKRQEARKWIDRQGRETAAP